MSSGSKGEVRGGNQCNFGEHRDTTSMWSVIILVLILNSKLTCVVWKNNKKSIFINHHDKSI